MEYDLNHPWKTLDDWQKEYIETKGNCFILCGRQSGKTAAMSIKIGKCAVEEKEGGDYLVIALTERQAYQLFFKTLMYLQEEYPKMIKKGKNRPTMHEIRLTNGIIIRCYAAGLTGEGLRTFTIKKLFIDEAAPMSREVFISVSPMLSVTRGTMDIASTPRGKEGYFFECSKRDDFKKFYISAEDCPRHNKEFLESEKATMSKLEYAQEYLAVFLDELRRIFPDDLINKICILKRKEQLITSFSRYLGVDVAGMGKDDTTLEILDKINKNDIQQIESEILRKKLTTEVSQRIFQLEILHNFKQIGVDDAGVGFGVFSELLRNDKTKRKVQALNNASRELNKDRTKHTKLLKEQMYLNLLSMMEKNIIKLLDDDEIIASLKSVQYEYVTKKGQQTTLRIFGNYTHLVEGIIRAAWLCSQDKTLNIYIY